MSEPSPTVVTAKPVLPSEAPPRPFQFRLIHLLVATGLVSVALAVLVPWYRFAKARSERMISANNLKHIAIGLHNYHDVWRSLPPAYSCDAAGNPAHSWRVLINPFMESTPLYSAYNFAEPWNGPNNSRLAKGAAHLFHNSTDRTTPQGMTNYVAVVGPGTMWPGKQSLRFAEVKDGMSVTIMVVEISHSDIHWMEPRDLPIEELEAWLDPKHKPRLGRIEGGLVGYADGSVRYVARDATVKELRALLTPAGDDWKDVPSDKY
jgi:hypothetical protein